MGFTVNDSLVRGDIFTDTGKWKYSVAIDMTYFYDMFPLQEAVRRAAQRTPAEVRGVTDGVVADGSGYTLVVLEPVHQHGHPVMIKL